MPLSAASGGGMADPMTTRGDAIIRNASNVTARLGVGAANTILSSDGTDILYQTRAALGLIIDPTTTRGDLLYRDASSVARLSIGADNRILRSDGTDPIWETLTTTLDDLGSTRGQILRRGATTWGVTSVGADNTLLTSNGTDPGYETLTSLLDSVMGSTRGMILRRNVTTWGTVTVDADAGSPFISDGTDPVWNSNIILGATGAVTWPTGLGAINHIAGPTDNPIRIISGTAQDLRIEPASGRDLLITTLGAGTTTIASAANGITLSSTTTTGDGIGISMTGASGAPNGLTIIMGVNVTGRGLLITHNRATAAAGTIALRLTGADESVGIEMTDGDTVGVSAADEGRFRYNTTIQRFQISENAGAYSNLQTVNPTVNGFRLTLTTATPVTTADVTGATTIYLSPYKSDRIALYNGTTWIISESNEISLALGTLVADTNYDVFVYDNASTLTLELSAAWTNNTTRAEAIARQDGVWIKSGTTTRRFIGTIRMTSTTATEDSAARRFVFNADNAIDRPMRVIETTDSWTYTLATYRSANNSVANRLQYVDGLGDRLICAQVRVSFQRSVDTTSAYAVVGIGIDSTSVTSAQLFNDTNKGANITTITCVYEGFPGLGFHFLQWLEFSAATGTGNWYGDASDPTLFGSGITGRIEI